MSETNDLPVTAREAGRRIGVSADTIKRALRADLIPGFTIGPRKDWRVRMSDVQAWIDRGAPTPKRPAKTQE